MRFVSTRRASEPHGVGRAMLQGLAPDGGLFVPEHFPAAPARGLDPEEPLSALAVPILAPFFEGDPLAARLPEICREAFDFPMPLVGLERETSLLELFHGPTAAFKDFGARFLAASLARMPETAATGGHVALTVLVATSGDTGAAVASAFHGRPGVRVGVLFPDGGVSPRQERQLSCWGGNVASLAVRGVFDDCQRLVKHAFTVDGWPPQGRLSSANSINVGRLLPQMLYYAVASLRYERLHGTPAGFVVPSGNVGNAVGALWARECGYPIREIAMATNANRVVPDWFRTGEWRPRPSRATLANAMDVGDPSNMERVFHLYPDRRALRDAIAALSVDDETIRRTIREAPRRWGQVVCPHTATALHFREKLPGAHWVVVATAHPAKFDTIVEPLIGHAIEVPRALAALLERPSHAERVEPTFEALVAALDGGAQSPQST